MVLASSSKMGNYTHGVTCNARHGLMDARSFARRDWIVTVDGALQCSDSLRRLEARTARGKAKPLENYGGKVVTRRLGRIIGL